MRLDEARIEVESLEFEMVVTIVALGGVIWKVNDMTLGNKEVV